MDPARIKAFADDDSDRNGEEYLKAYAKEIIDLAKFLVVLLSGVDVGQDVVHECKEDKHAGNHPDRVPGTVGHTAVKAPVGGDLFRQPGVQKSHHNHHPKCNAII